MIMIMMMVVKEPKRKIYFENQSSIINVIFLQQKTKKQTLKFDDNRPDDKRIFLHYEFIVGLIFRMRIVDLIQKKIENEIV